MNTEWALATPVDAVIFDCDGTLSRVEGIDELARLQGVTDQVKALTEKAMGQTGLNLDLYRERIRLVQPTRQQVLDLGQFYFTQQTQDIAAVIAILLRLKKTIYILSAGLAPAVKVFGELLGVSVENIFAVDLEFDEVGNYINFNQASPLVSPQGKAIFVNKLKQTHENILYFGDGLNDLAALPLVTRFVGYGGVFFYENFAKHCQFYINTPTTSPLLPLGLSQTEYTDLTPAEKIVYDKGLLAIEERKVIIKT